MALSRGAMGWSVIVDVPSHTHLIFENDTLRQNFAERTAATVGEVDQTEYDRQYCRGVIPAFRY